MRWEIYLQYNTYSYLYSFKLNKKREKLSLWAWLADVFMDCTRVWYVWIDGIYLMYKKGGGEGRGGERGGSRNVVDFPG